jgi:hypothetical protein
MTQDQCRRYRDARIRGIQTMRTIHPAATPVDLHILVSSIVPQIFLEHQDTEAESSEVPGVEKCHYKAVMRKGKEGS